MPRLDRAAHLDGVDHLPRRPGRPLPAEHVGLGGRRRDGGRVRLCAEPVHPPLHLQAFGDPAAVHRVAVVDRVLREGASTRRLAVPGAVRIDGARVGRGQCDLAAPRADRARVVGAPRVVRRTRDDDPRGDQAHPAHRRSHGLDLAVVDRRPPDAGQLRHQRAALHRDVPHGRRQFFVDRDRPLDGVLVPLRRRQLWTVVPRRRELHPFTAHAGHLAARPDRVCLLRAVGPVPLPRVLRRDHPRRPRRLRGCAPVEKSVAVRAGVQGVHDHGLGVGHALDPAGGAAAGARHGGVLRPACGPTCDWRTPERRSRWSP